MTATATQLGVPPSRRVRSLIAPREHGAWGLLLVPLVTGGAIGLLAGGNGRLLIAFIVAALALFWLRTPLESWLGTSLIRAQTQREQRTVGITILVLAAVATVALVSLFPDGKNRKLLLLGLVAISALVAQGLLQKLGRSTRMLAQVVGTLGLTVTAPAAYYLLTGQLDRNAWALWFANFLFAGNQIHFVQLRIHSAGLSTRSEKFAHGRSFVAGEFLLVAALWCAWRFCLLPWLAVLAFLPIVVRGTAWFLERAKALLVRRLGWTELAHAVVFAVCLIAGFHLGR